MPASNATPRARWLRTASTRWSRRSAGSSVRIFDANNTFRAVAEEWLVKITREERAEVTFRKVRWLLDMVYPFLGELPLQEIEVQEVLAVLRKVEATGRYESARRMRSVISRVFRYGIAAGRAKHGTARDLRGAIIFPKTKHFAAITRPRKWASSSAISTIAPDTRSPSSRCG